MPLEGQNTCPGYISSLSCQLELTVDNQDVAKVLDEIADLLDIEGESIFRVQAYRRAANSIQALAEDIESVSKEERLRELQGVGKGIAEKIEELLATGKIEYHEELKEKIPPSLVELIQIPGLGPKKAKMLYEQLNIQTTDGLLEAIEAHKVAPLKGFGIKTEKNIFKGIKQFREGRERILLSEAYPIAERVLGNLRKAPFVIKADAAGSLRRMKETIGDIDLLAASTKPLAVMDYFCNLPEVDRILVRGETKSSIITTNSLQVDLRVVAPEQYGSALQYFTGSKEHNVHLRDIAKKRGLKINEYGLFKTKSDKKIAGEGEEEIYSMLQMQYIPPVIRENTGEIEKAEKHKLPRLVELEDIKGDLHVHSAWSDGFDGIETMVARALKLGLSYIAVCDHAERLKVAGGLSKEQVWARKREIDKLNENLDDFTVLNGIELNIDNDGKLDYDDEFLKEFDVVVASVHAGFNQPEELLTKRILSAIYNPNVDIIAHPTGRILGRRAAYALDIKTVFAAAAETGTFLELNSYPDRLDLKDIYLREAKAQGIKIAINTDAHSNVHLGYMMFGVATARRGWLEAKDVVNTYPVNEVMSMIRAKSK